MMKFEDGVPWFMMAEGSAVAWRSGQHLAHPKTLKLLVHAQHLARQPLQVGSRRVKSCRSKVSPFPVQTSL